MKHITLTLLLTLIPFSFSYAQDTEVKTKVREIGFTTSNLNNFGFTYRKGKANRVWRINAISNTISENERSITNNNIVIAEEGNNFGFGLSIGQEWRSSVKEKLELRYGFDFSYTYRNNKDKELDDITQSRVISESVYKYSSTGINMVFGFNFLLANDFLLGGEILPGYNFFKEDFTRETFQIQDDKREFEGSGFNLNTSSLRLSLLYRF